MGAGTKMLHKFKRFLILLCKDKLHHSISPRPGYFLKATTPFRCIRTEGNGRQVSQDSAPTAVPTLPRAPLALQAPCPRFVGSPPGMAAPISRTPRGGAPTFAALLPCPPRLAWLTRSGA